MDLIDAFVTARTLNQRQIKKRIRLADFCEMSEQDAVVLIARLLLHERGFEDGVFDVPTDTSYTARLMRLQDKQKKKLRRAMFNWFYIRTSHAASLYPLYLYNIKYGKTRKIFNLLLKAEAMPPAYLYRVIPNILCFYFGDEKVKLLMAEPDNIDLWAPALNQLFNKTGPVRHWLEVKDRSLFYYGGQTNTILGIYDDSFGVDTGAQMLNRNADAYYDLGGGYNTPEIERLTGLKFTSLDILEPCSHTENLMLVRKIRQGEVLVTAEERQQYLDRLAQIQHIPFNVFENQLPAEYQSYVIVSTGFLTSTIRSDSPGHGGLGFYRTSLAGIEAIMRLVRMGKDVDLFTVNRATVRSYAFKTILLSFRNGRVVNLIATVDPATRFSNIRKEKIMKMIHPDSSPYRGYTECVSDEWRISVPRIDPSHDSHT